MHADRHTGPDEEEAPFLKLALHNLTIDLKRGEERERERTRERERERGKRECV